jgi:hypothetical protein
MESGSIEENELASFHIFDSENTVPCGLGFLSDDGNLIPKDAVEQG